MGSQARRPQAPDTSGAAQKSAGREDSDCRGCAPGPRDGSPPGRALEVALATPPEFRRNARVACATHQRVSAAGAGGGGLAADDFGDTSAGIGRGACSHGPHHPDALGGLAVSRQGSRWTTSCGPWGRDRWRRPASRRRTQSRAPPWPLAGVSGLGRWGPLILCRLPGMFGTWFATGAQQCGGSCATSRPAHFCSSSRVLHACNCRRPCRAKGKRASAGGSRPRLSSSPWLRRPLQRPATTCACTWWSRTWAFCNKPTERPSRRWHVFPDACWQSTRGAMTPARGPPFLAGAPSSRALAAGPSYREGLPEARGSRPASVGGTHRPPPGDTLGCGGCRRMGRPTAHCHGGSVPGTGRATRRSPRGRCDPGPTTLARSPVARRRSGLLRRGGPGA